MERNATAGTQTMDNLLQINNNDTDGAVTNGIHITAAAGLITNAINVNDAQITNIISHVGGLVTSSDLDIIDDGQIDAADVAADVATQAEIDLKADLAAPALTGDATTATTPAVTDNDTTIANTAFVHDIEKTVCKTVETLVDADDNVPIHHFNGASTIIKVACHADLAITVSMADLAGDDVDDGSDQVCSTGTGVLTWDSTLTGTTAFTDGEGIEFDTISQSAPTWTTICFAYTTP